LGIDKFVNWIKGYHHGSLIKKGKEKRQKIRNDREGVTLKDIRREQQA
jgi:hypothetical protein